MLLPLIDVAESVTESAAERIERERDTVQSSQAAVFYSTYPRATSQTVEEEEGRRKEKAVASVWIDRGGVGEIR